MADSIPAKGLAQVKYVSVDNPSAHLVDELRIICPNLHAVALDHLAMTWEYASSHKFEKIENFGFPTCPEFLNFDKLENLFFQNFQVFQIFALNEKIGKRKNLKILDFREARNFEILSKLIQLENLKTYFFKIFNFLP